MPTMSLDPSVIAAFDRFFETMGVTSSEDKAAIVRQVYASEALLQRLKALAARLIAEACDPC